MPPSLWHRAPTKSRLNWTVSYLSNNSYCRTMSHAELMDTPWAKTTNRYAKLLHGTSHCLSLSSCFPCQISSFRLWSAFQLQYKNRQRKWGLSFLTLRPCIAHGKSRRNSYRCSQVHWGCSFAYWRYLWTNFYLQVGVHRCSSDLDA